jgi:putative membrane protein
MMGIGLIWMLIFWGGIILLALLLISLLFPNDSHSSTNHPRSSSAARDILDQRFARGELSPEQYQEMRQTIEQKN